MIFWVAFSAMVCALVPAVLSLRRGGGLGCAARAHVPEQAPSAPSKKLLHHDASPDARSAAS